MIINSICVAAYTDCGKLQWTLSGLWFILAGSLFWRDYSFGGLVLGRTLGVCMDFNSLASQRGFQGFQTFNKSLTIHFCYFLFLNNYNCLHSLYNATLTPNRFSCIIILYYHLPVNIDNNSFTSVLLILTSAPCSRRTRTTSL